MLGSAIATLSLALDGLLAGVFLCSSMVEHAARTLPSASWVDYKQAKEGVFGPVMPAFFGVGLIVTVLAAVWTRPEPAILAAAVLLAVVLAITASVHVPLNKRIQNWSSAAAPAEWQAVRSRWRNWNWLRTGLAVAAFGLVVAASRL